MAKPRKPVIRSLLASLTVEAQHILGGSAPDDDEIDHVVLRTLSVLQFLGSGSSVL